LQLDKEGGKVLLQDLFPLFDASKVWHRTNKVDAPTAIILDGIIRHLLAPAKNETQGQIDSQIYKNEVKVLFTLVFSEVKKNGGFSPREFANLQGMFEYIQNDIQSEIFVQPKIEAQLVSSLFLVFKKIQIIADKFVHHRGKNGEIDEQLEDYKQKERLGTMMSIVLYLALLRELGKSKHPIVQSLQSAKKKLQPKKSANKTGVVYENKYRECGIITP